MEERRAHGFRVRHSYGQVLGHIAEGEPLPINLPNRNASILTSSHFWLQDYPESTEPEPAPLPHTTVDPAAAYEDANEGYDGVPFPRRDFRPRPFDLDSESDFGAVDPGQALRNDGLNPPPAPGFLGRLQQAEAAAEAAAGLAGSVSPLRGTVSAPAARSSSAANHRPAFGNGAAFGARGSEPRRWRGRQPETSSSS